MRLKLGTNVHIIGGGLGLRRGLLEACGVNLPTPRAPSKGPGRGRHHREVSPEDPVTDAVLAEMRGDHELRGARPCEIAQKVGIAYERCYKLLNYATRAHIEPV